MQKSLRSLQAQTSTKDATVAQCPAWSQVQNVYRSAASSGAALIAETEVRYKEAASVRFIVRLATSLGSKPKAAAGDARYVEGRGRFAL